jgi:hypothetical protein
MWFRRYVLSWRLLSGVERLSYHGEMTNCANFGSDFAGYREGGDEVEHLPNIGANLSAI